MTIRDVDLNEPFERTPKPEKERDSKKEPLQKHPDNEWPFDSCENEYDFT